MKKLVYGLAAVALAIGGIAVTKANKAQVNRYYFQYTTNGNVLKTIQPLYQGTDPFNCNGLDIKCEVIATSYSVSSGGVYTPSGTQTIAYKPL